MTSIEKYNIYYHVIIIQKQSWLSSECRYYFSDLSLLHSHPFLSAELWFQNCCVLMAYFAHNLWASPMYLTHFCITGKPNTMDVLLCCLGIEK